MIRVNHSQGSNLTVLRVGSRVAQLPLQLVFKLDKTFVTGRRFSVAHVVNRVSCLRGTTTFSYTFVVYSFHNSSFHNSSCNFI